MVKPRELTLKGLSRVLTGILKEETNMKINKSTGKFVYERYLGDELSPRALVEIADSDDPKNTFYDQFNIYEFKFYPLDWVVYVIKENWNEDKYGNFDFYSDAIYDWVRNRVHVNIPYDHYLNQLVDVNITIDTGDGDYDYTLNSLFDYKHDGVIPSDSSLLWLTLQQGYTKADLNNLIRKGHDKGSSFLKSVYAECANVTSQINRLTCLVKMTLRDFINLKTQPKRIVLSTNTTVGLFDNWNGGGSLFGIKLEKPLVIPPRFMVLKLDFEHRYGVKAVYGADSSMWTGELLSHSRSSALEKRNK